MKIKAACIQLAAYDVTQSDKAMKNALDKIDEAIKEQPQLVVLPRMRISRILYWYE